MEERSQSVSDVFFSSNLNTKMAGRRLLRSVLFTPADRADRMRKALLSAADVVILDLEDAVSPDMKEIGRKNVVELLHEISAGTTQPYGTVCVRINCMKSTTWGMHDLRAISAVKCDAVLLPKVEDVSIVDMAIETLENGAKWEIGTKPTSVWVMIETARGIQRAEEIADTEGVSTLIFGSNDLTKDLKSRHTPTREPLLYSMSRCILAARAAGKQVVDGVHLDINDQHGFAVSCEQGRSLGFDGKSLIHPTQIDAANKVSKSHLYKPYYKYSIDTP